MWYGDFMPSWWHHRKKGLTKAQMQKLRAAYAQAWEIQESVWKLEEVEKRKIQEKLDADIENFPS